MLSIISQTMSLYLWMTTHAFHCGVTPMIKHARKSVDRQRVIGFTMQLYTGSSFPRQTDDWCLQGGGDSVGHSVSLIL